MKLDEVDKQIIRLLLGDGRMKLKDLGSQLRTKKKDGYSHVGVKKRLTRLLENDVIKIQANLNMGKLDLILAIMLLELENYGIVKKIFEKYERCPKILFIFQTSGKFNVIFAFLAETMKEAEAYVNFCSPKNEIGVRNSRIFYSSARIQPSFMPVPYFQTEKKDLSPCNRDCSDCDYFTSDICPACPACSVYKGGM